MIGPCNLKTTFREFSNYNFLIQREQDQHCQFILTKPTNQHHLHIRVTFIQANFPITKYPKLIH